MKFSQLMLTFIFTLSASVALAAEGEVKLKGNNLKLTVGESITLGEKVFNIEAATRFSIEGSRRVIQNGEVVESENIVIVTDSVVLKQVMRNPAEYFAFDPESRINQNCSKASNAVVLISNNLLNKISGNCAVLK